MDALRYVPRRESASTRRTKSSRATEQGIAGHRAAMNALGTAAGGWVSSNTLSGIQSDRFKTIRQAVNPETKKVFTPGVGHVADPIQDGERGIEKQHYNREYDARKDTKKRMKKYGK
jgi:hypothetical protein